MNLNLEMGAGTSDLQMAGLSLTGLDIILGAGKSTVDLSGGLTRDLDVTISAGAANVTVRLPKDIGVRVEINAGPTAINAPGLTKDGNVYTNDAYGVSDAALQNQDRDRRRPDKLGRRISNLIQGKNSMNSNDLVINTEGLSKSFGEVQALKSLDMRVPQRSIFAFLGPNGSGKTTTIKLLLGLLKPTSGGGQIFGKDIIRD